MVIISVEHAKPKIEGYLTRHMLKIRPGIFVGRLSKTRRDCLWEHIIDEQPDIDSVMCYDIANKTISIQTHGNPTRKVVDVDGIQLLAYPQFEPWKELLAKPDKPLWEHSVETAIMSDVFLRESNYSMCLDILYEQIDPSVSKEQLLQNILFIIGLHDIGKLHPFFQQNLISKPQKLDIRYGFRHEKESWRQLNLFLSHIDMDRKVKRILTNAVQDHHQGKPTSIFEAEANEEADTSTSYSKNVHDMIEYMNELHPFTPFAVTGKRNLFGQLLSGILRFSDWAASSYYTELSSTSEDYINRCYEKARDFLRDGGLMTAHIPSMEYDYKALCGLDGDTLYPLQRKLIDVMKENPKAECILIEDQPGSGKTEGAFYAATKLLQSYGHSGLYVALPTDATASEMLPRLKKCFKEHGLFDDVDTKLLTGKAWLHKDTAKTEDEKDKIEWENKARKLFSPLACGTVDQLMQAGMNLKADDLRLLALTNKVVIIDEFHAYDAYMMEIIKTLLRWLRAMHVPVVILSATLLEDTRKELFSIYSEDSLGAAGYPRITCACEGHVKAYTCDPAVHKEYMCETVMKDDTVAKVLDSVASGGNTLYIANTVKNAVKIFRDIHSSAPDIKIHLYTARTTPKNKKEMGDKFVYLYGKEGKEKGKRPSKTIVVSTQIMEMSVDVDFDTVFSELAPADALLQRIGRMRRHSDEGTVRENGFQSIFYLVIPEKKGKWYLPYVATVLEGTERVFSKVSTIKVPEDIPELLENSYALADKKWLDEALASHGKEKVIKKPEDPYDLSKDLKSSPATRYQTYITETVICVPDGEDVHDTCEWAREAVLEKSITLPVNISETIPSIQDTESAKWLHGYKIVRDKTEFWGADKQFIYGVEEDQN